MKNENTFILIFTAVALPALLIYWIMTMPTKEERELRRLTKVVKGWEEQVKACLTLSDTLYYYEKLDPYDKAMGAGLTNFDYESIERFKIKHEESVIQLESARENLEEYRKRVEWYKRH